MTFDELFKGTVFKSRTLWIDGKRYYDVTRVDGGRYLIKECVRRGMATGDEEIAKRCPDFAELKS